MIISIIGMGTAAISGVLLEKHLIKNERIYAADMVNKITFHGIRCSGILFITYAFIKTVGWFL